MENGTTESKRERRLDHEKRAAGERVDHHWRRRRRDSGLGSNPAGSEVARRWKGRREGICWRALWAAASPSYFPPISSVACVTVAVFTFLLYLHAVFVLGFDFLKKKTWRCLLCIDSGIEVATGSF
jgi:hypothetical protein